MTYLNGWEYWYIAQRDLEHGKADKWISTNMEKNHRTQISQKIWKRKDLEEPASYKYLVYNLVVYTILAILKIN